MEATSAFYPDKKEVEFNPTKNYARIFGKDGFMEVESSPDIDSKRESPTSDIDVKPSVEEIQRAVAVKSDVDGFDVVAGRKRKLKQELMEEYQARLAAFRSYKLHETNKRINAKPFKCQACNSSFPTKG